MKTIELRGHHIDAFANHFYRRTSKELADDLIKSLFVETYGLEMTLKLDALWKKITTNPNLRIKIVNGLDYICGICSAHTYNCADADKLDNFCLKEFGLKLGNTYTARDLIQKISDYKKRTGLESPRDKFDL